MTTRDTSHLTWVLEHMPKESNDALIKFTSINPHWRGAGWDDCLDQLMDTDSHLEVVEPLFERSTESVYPARLISAVAITLLYASQDFAELSTPDMQWIQVEATIRNNHRIDGSPDRVWVNGYQDGQGHTVAGYWRERS